MAADQGIDVQTLIAAIRAHDLSGLEQLLTVALSESLVNQADEKGFTPLIWAVREGSQEMVERLLASGANPNTGPHIYEAPLPYSINLREHGIATLLMMAHDLKLSAMGFAAAVNAVMGGDFEGVRLLIDNGVDLSAKVPEKSDVPDAVNQATALLFLAIRYAKHRPELIKLLVKQGADVEASCDGKTSVLGELCNQLTEYPAALNVLLDAGASMNRLDGAGYTPLHYAAAHDHYESCKLLLEKGADADQIATDGTFPLLWAATNVGNKVHKFLLDDDVSSGPPEATILRKLPSGWSWSPAEGNWGALSLAAADGAWTGISSGRSEKELFEHLNRRYGSVRGLQPPLVIVRLLRPSTRRVPPFPWRLPGEEMDITVGQCLDLLYLAPLHAKGISQQTSPTEIYKFALIPAVKVPEALVSAPRHPVEIVRIITYCEGFIENLDAVKCQYDGQSWMLS